ncbi:uncharacterized protein LOC121414191 [Lytechinus variegatus]|uniref:uncharacterized protein LOC121414191 n=1 Tax=Lytechinus variegatus TaxID=7654 RepID=UPI001BB1392D|nr:uncharacterized protein LOC121414191 [Lytechinus variegatus]
MPARCIVGGCSNTTKDGASLHLFPKDANLRRIWVSKVKLTRANWSGPSDWSVVCSSHFEDADFDDGLHAAFGMKRTRRLKPDAVPKIRSGTSMQVKRSGSRTAADKRKKMRMLDELLSTSVEARDAEEQGSAVEPTSMESQSDTDEPGCSQWTDEHSSESEESFDEQPFKDPAMEFQQHGLTTSVGIQVSVATRVKRSQRVVLLQNTGSQIPPDIPAFISRGTSFDKGDIPEEKVDSKEVEEERISSPESDAAEPSSPGYKPPSSSSSSSDERVIAKPQKRRRKRKRRPSKKAPWEAPAKGIPPHKEKKYIVFESKLLELLQFCPSCKSSNVSLVKREVGSLLSVTRECLSCDQKSTTWESQPWIGPYPAGNLQLSAAILFAGGSPSESLRVLKHFNVATHSRRTFFRHQKKVLHPAITNQWQKQQNHLLTELCERGLPLTIGGDGRADSPGHSAKFGVYTALELNINKIVDFQLVQSNEVKGSYHMELEGFKRVVNFLDDKGLVIRKVVTDRHRQLAKYIRITLPHIIHVYDVWHVSKGVGKKVHALAKQKDCEELVQWEPSITNHMYWVAATCEEDEDDLRVAKWKSLMNHIQGIHEGHSEVFPKCLHGDLEAQGRKKKWLTPGTKVCEKLTGIVQSTMLLNDVKKLSGDQQTSSLESYHSLVNRYAPKLKSYSYEGMTSRLRLAAMDFNENGNRQQAKTLKGDKRYMVSKPKYKPGKASVKAVKEAKTFKFVDDLMDEVGRLCTGSSQLPERKDAPPSLCSEYTFPSKEELVQDHRSRFN